MELSVALYKLRSNCSSHVHVESVSSPSVLLNTRIDSLGWENPPAVSVTSHRFIHGGTRLNKLNIVSAQRALAHVFRSRSRPIGLGE